MYRFLIVLLLYIPLKTEAQENVFLLSMNKVKGNVTEYGGIKTGVLLENIDQFKTDTKDYDCYGVSSFNIRYYDYPLEHSKLNIFVGVQKRDHKTIMIPDLNYDSDFSNDTLLVFENTNSLSNDSINALSASLRPFKMKIPLSIDGTAKEDPFIYLRLRPRTYFTYAKKHPAKSKRDSLYVNAIVSQHYECDLVLNKQSFKILVQDISLGMVKNTIGIGNNEEALIKIIPEDSTGSKQIFFERVNEKGFYNNDYLFQAKIMGEYHRLSLNVTKTSKPGTGVLAGQHAKPFRGTDIITKKKYSITEKGKNTLLFFWFVGCGPCHEIMPALNNLQTQERDSLRILSICTGGSHNAILNDIKRFKINYPVLGNYTGSNQAIDVLYKIQSAPTLILISEEGKIVQRTGSLNDIKDLL